MINIQIHEDPEISCSAIVHFIKLEKDEIKKSLLFQDLVSKSALLRPEVRYYYLSEALRSYCPESINKVLENTMTNHISPKRRADIAIVTVIKPEFEAAKHVFDIPKEKKEDNIVNGLRYWEFDHPKYDGNKYKMVLTMVGEPRNTPCAIACERLFNTYDVGLCILVGIAAGNKEKLNLGDVVVADQIIDYEGQRLEPEGPKKRPYSYTMDTEIQRALSFFDPQTYQWHNLLSDLYNKEDSYKGLSKNLKDNAPRFKHAVIFAGEKIIADGSLKNMQDDYHNQGLVAEMEGSGFAKSCKEYKIPWLVFRGVSDFGDPDKPASDEYQSIFTLSAVLAASLFIKYEYRQISSQ